MPIPAGPSDVAAWSPTLAEVADYTTARTMVAQPDGSNSEQFAFTSVTRPTAEQVTRLIAGAVAEISGRCGTVDVTLYPVARALAARLTAGYVELRYPERQSANRDDAITTAKELLRRVDEGITALAARNETVTGIDPVFDAAPVWSFPPAPCDYLY